MTVGIYTITSPSGRVYVGQSISIERRFAEYRRKGSVKKQRRLMASFAKYGVDNHVFVLVVECDEHALYQYEREWQERLDVCGELGMNCRLVSGLDKTGRFSEESRQRMSERQRGRGNPNFGKRGVETSCFGRKRTDTERESIKAYQATRGQIIQQFDLNGNLIGEARIRDFAVQGHSQGNISSCCTGRLKTHHGFVFKYKETL